MRASRLAADALYLSRQPRRSVVIAVPRECRSIDAQKSREIAGRERSGQPLRANLYRSTTTEIELDIFIQEPMTHTVTKNKFPSTIPSLAVKAP